MIRKPSRKRSLERSKAVVIRCFLYARVSMENIDDEREQDPENQLKPMREFCKLKNWTIQHEYVERLSGADPLRPKFLEMLSAIKRKEADTILVWAVDRFSRLDPMEAIIIYAELILNKIDFYSLEEPYVSTIENDTPEDLRLMLVAWVLSNARREHTRISSRTKAGIASKRAKGEWKGGRPKGSKDSKERIRRWESKPEINAAKLLGG